MISTQQKQEILDKVHGDFIEKGYCPSIISIKVKGISLETMAFDPITMAEGIAFLLRKLISQQLLEYFIVISEAYTVECSEDGEKGLPTIDEVLEWKKENGHLSLHPFSKNFINVIFSSANENDNRLALIDNTDKYNRTLGEWEEWGTKNNYIAPPADTVFGNLWNEGTVGLN